ncbi:MAG TPA: O-methyltransferase [Terriglobales bacterium]
MDLQERWSAVDAYIESKIVGEDSALRAAAEASVKAGLPTIAVTPAQGKLLNILAKSIGATRMLEIGTLGGYSTIWLARALPQAGKLITLEVNPKHADVARQNIARAGLESKVDMRIAAALDSLPVLAQERHVFDFVFIDADKQNISAYFDWSLRVTRSGSLILIDNVVREGEIIDAESRDVNVQGVRQMYDRLSGETRVTATAVQTVGSKKYDGFVLAVVN